MNTDKLFKFMYRGISPQNLNDSSLNSGIYRLGSPPYTNAPTAHIYGILVAFKDGYSYGGQILFGTNVNKIYLRTWIFSESSYSDWMELS